MPTSTVEDKDTGEEVHESDAQKASLDVDDAGTQVALAGREELSTAAAEVEAKAEDAQPTEDVSVNTGIVYEPATEVDSTTKDGKDASTAKGLVASDQDSELEGAVVGTTLEDAQFTDVAVSGANANEEATELAPMENAAVVPEHQPSAAPVVVTTLVAPTAPVPSALDPHIVATPALPVLDPAAATSGFSRPDSNPDVTEKKKTTSPKKYLYRKRICRFPGCTRCVKAQGHCQRHGARVQKCKHPDCPNQAQGSHQGFCKRHWREFMAPPEKRKVPKKKEEESITPIGESIYDRILPACFNWKIATKSSNKNGPDKEGDSPSQGVASAASNSPLDAFGDSFLSSNIFPLAQYLDENSHLEAGWHRRLERLSRGIVPPKTVSTQLETWEKQLMILEMALLSGTYTGAQLSLYNRRLAHAWGRDKCFYKMVVDQLSSRRGDLDRKKRMDSGQKMSTEKKRAYKLKLNRTMGIKKQKLTEDVSHHLKEEPDTVEGDELMETVEDELATNVYVGGASLALTPEAGATIVSSAQFPTQTALHTAQHDPPPMEPPSVEEMVEDGVDV